MYRLTFIDQRGNQHVVTAKEGKVDHIVERAENQGFDLLKMEEV